MAFVLPAAWALVYLVNIPIKIAFYARLSGGIASGVGIAAFEARFARRRAHKSKVRPRGRGLLNFEEGWSFKSSAIYLIRRARLEAFEFEARLNDAMATALAVGLARAVATAFMAHEDCRAHLRVKPDFESGERSLYVSGIASLYFGHIIIACYMAGKDYIRGRLAKWKNTR